MNNPMSDDQLNSLTEQERNRLLRYLCHELARYVSTYRGECTRDHIFSTCLDIVRNAETQYPDILSFIEQDSPERKNYEQVRQRIKDRFQDALDRTNERHGGALKRLSDQ